MTGGEIAMVAGGAALAAAGLWVLVRNRQVGEFFAGMERDEHKHSLLNAERVERIRESVDAPGTRVLDRGKAIFLGVWLVIVAASLIAAGLG